MRKDGMQIWPGVPMALAAAALFGASMPAAKLLLGGGLSPALLAGVFYLGSGIGLGIVLLIRRGTGRAGGPPFSRSDLAWLGLVVLCGGVAGPLLLMAGLAVTPASAAALLLNLEGLATMAIAWTAFHEKADCRLLAGAAAILAGAGLLSWRGGDDSGALGLLGSSAIAAACLAWGIDNNLTRKLSAGDPIRIACVKGLAAGLVNTALALGQGAALPAPPTLAAAGLIGFFGYGVSLVLFVLALRHLGTARTGAYFSSAPFLGSLLAVLLLGEPVTWQLAAALPLMGLGIYLHVTERHEHAHAHAAAEHEHRHLHDAHHQHEHDATSGPEPHSHRHRHAPLAHSHAHYPDDHHRHGHAD